VPPRRKRCAILDEPDGHDVRIERRQIRMLTDRAEQAMADGRPDEAADRWRAVMAHPCAHHQIAPYEILDEVHRAYREAGRYDDAIAAKLEAIADGFRSVPDPEADIAECLLDAGRIEEADELFATLRERDPEDVWLHNSAAYSYAGMDVARSLGWALDGIEVALATGDPDQVVMQLLELAEDAWEELGEPIEQQLVDRVERFCTSGRACPRAVRGATCPPLRTDAAPTAATSQRPAVRNWTSAPAATDADCWRPRLPRNWPGSTPPSARNPKPSCRDRSDSPSVGSQPTSGPRCLGAGRICSTTSLPTTSLTATRPKHGSSASPGTPPAAGCTLRR
jgi:hypothetical protein